MTGETYSPAFNRYGETASSRVAGIVWKGVSYSTRKHVWRVLKVDSEDVTLRSEAPAERTQCHAGAVSLGPVSITVPNPFLPSWSFDDCTTQH